MLYVQAVVSRRLKGLKLVKRKEISNKQIEGDRNVVNGGN